MIKLLRANFARVIKNATFWIFIALYGFYAIFLPIIFKSNPLEPDYTDQVFAINYGIAGFPLQGAIIAILCSVILGADFHNSTLRNKIIMGHTRNQIYVANLLTTVIISLALNATYMMFFFMISFPLYGNFTFPAKDLLLLFIDGTFMMFAYSAVYTFTAMICRNPMISLIVSTVLLSLSFILIIGFADIVNESQYYYEINGEWIAPNMSSKLLRDFSEFMLDFLPSGQSYQLANNNIVKWQMPLYSLVIIGATTGTGMAIFKKANIK